MVSCHRSGRRSDDSAFAFCHLVHLYVILIAWAGTVHLAANLHSPFTNIMMPGEDLGRRHRTSETCGEGVFLDLDQACLQLLLPSGSSSVDLLAQSKECVGCPLWDIWSGDKSKRIPVNATWPTQILVQDSATEQKLCDMEFHFLEQGQYQLALNGSAHDCTMRLTNNPVPPALPILYAFLLLSLVKFFWTLYRNLRKSRTVRIYFSRFRRGAAEPDIQRDLADDRQLLMSHRSHDPTSTRTEPAAEALLVQKTQLRLRSLDAFRGLSIALMIFVNYGGGGYWFFAHSRWNGLTVADLVFPWFLWIMGVSLALGMQAQLLKGVPKCKILIKILKRAAVLFLLGLFVNSSGKNDFQTLRIPGVLQRFSFTYCVAALLELGLMKREPLSSHPGTWWAPLRDLCRSPFQWLFMTSVVALHTGLTFLLKVPGCPTGYLGPGGLHDQARHENCTGGAARYVDVQFFGSQHIYQHPTPMKIYDTHVPFDPEGLLGSFTSLFLVFLGVQAGKIILAFPSWQSRVKRFWIWTFVLGSLAGLLCDFSKEAGVIPVNKNLWSLSFILALGSMAFFLFSLMYIVIDVFKIWTGSPFFYPGMNSILLYIGHEVCHGYFPFAWSSRTAGHAELLAMNLWATSLWVFGSYLLFKANIFLAL